MTGEEILAKRNGKMTGNTMCGFGSCGTTRAEMAGNITSFAYKDSDDVIWRINSRQVYNQTLLDKVENADLMRMPINGCWICVG